MASSLDKVCRICGYSPLDSRHRTRLFGGRSLTDTLQLADTLTAIIGRPVRQGDGLPGYVCRQCLRMLEKVRAFEVELESLKKSVCKSSAALASRFATKRLTLLSPQGKPAAKNDISVSPSTAEKCSNRLVVFM